MITGPCPYLGGRNLKCHSCAHRKRTDMAETEFGKYLWRCKQVWGNIFNKPMMCDTGMWGDDLYVTLWHHHDPAQTPLWHHADLFWPCCVNSVATPILPCSPIRKSIYHRLWVESSVSGVMRSTLIHVPASSPHIRPTWSGSGCPRPVTSTPGLWAHSFPGPLIIFWWVTWPRLRLEGCDGGI